MWDHRQKFLRVPAGSLHEIVDQKDVARASLWNLRKPRILRLSIDEIKVINPRRLTLRAINDNQGENLVCLRYIRFGLRSVGGSDDTPCICFYEGAGLPYFPSRNHQRWILAQVPHPVR